jgi:hypothetical protein
MCRPAWANARTAAKQLADDVDAALPDDDIRVPASQGADTEPIRNREAAAVEPQLA